MDAATLKRNVGKELAGWVTSGMILGFGTGSTATAAMEALALRCKNEGLDVRGVPTSFASEQCARALGLPRTSLDEVEVLDLAFDGADEVDASLRLIKGRGAAHTREKIVASQAKRVVILVDDSKKVSRLGERMPVPVEIVPMALRPVSRLIERLGARPVLRMGMAKDGPVVTDQGLWVLDAFFEGGMENPDAVALALDACPGVLEHGLFLGMATDVLVAHPDGRIEHLVQSDT